MCSQVLASVQQMGSIYQHARRVIAWLGMPDDPHPYESVWRVIHKDYNVQEAFSFAKLLQGTDLQSRYRRSTERGLLCISDVGPPIDVPPIISTMISGEDYTCSFGVATGPDYRSYKNSFLYRTLCSNVVTPHWSSML